MSIRSFIDRATEERRQGLVVGRVVFLERSFRRRLDLGEHRIELALQMRNLVVGNRNARKMRDAADDSSVDGHNIRPLTAKPIRRIAEAGFAPQPALGTSLPSGAGAPGPISPDPGSIRPP